MDDFDDEPAFRQCRATLNSSVKLESLVLVTLYYRNGWIEFECMPVESSVDDHVDIGWLVHYRCFLCYISIFLLTGKFCKMGAATWEVSTLLLPMVSICKSWCSSPPLRL
eukprot:TRINITY_DN8946_c0_g2_i2.p1 TRINITY_DN8946_c0_g2~~TRINITY_DN8946_c0_g2_i2.p1  ORF type:complete len:110 (+),score=3.71 TRINITY_DN8946_c0_g2_i2:185-514(+)